ncbi:hypothetical protein NL351_29375, partial [Klebsiella pneumoniae]|nr:hypothetical protein [Klebsiella pneumoniae]
FVVRQCRAVAEIIVSGIAIPAFRITLGGFDNHARERYVEAGVEKGAHPDLMSQLGMGLAILRKALKAVRRPGLGVGDTFWDDT